MYSSTTNIWAQTTTGIAALTASRCPLRRLCLPFVVGGCRRGLGGGGDFVVSHTVVLACSSRLSLEDLCSPKVSRWVGKCTRFFYANILCAVAAGRPQGVEILGTCIDDSKPQEVNPTHPFPVPLPACLHAAFAHVALSVCCPLDLLSSSFRPPFVLCSYPFLLSTSFRLPFDFLSTSCRLPFVLLISSSFPLSSSLRPDLLLLSFRLPFGIRSSSFYPHFVFRSSTFSSFWRFIFLDALLALGVARRLVPCRVVSCRVVSWVGAAGRGVVVQRTTWFAAC